jgi:hypothetical protein
MAREHPRRWPWKRKERPRLDDDGRVETPEAAERRKQARDAWRTRNPFNHGDPPGVGGLH